VTDPQPPEPGVELSKTTPELPTATPLTPVSPAGTEPTWRRAATRSGWACVQCDRPPGQHGVHGRWWACWEVDAIELEINYWQRSFLARVGKTRPPELANNPAYVPPVGDVPAVGHPTRLLYPEPFWQRVWRYLVEGH
jgi:hypothetical protein